MFTCLPTNILGFSISWISRFPEFLYFETYGNSRNMEIWEFQEFGNTKIMYVCIHTCILCNVCMFVLNLKNIWHKNHKIYGQIHVHVMLSAANDLCQQIWSYSNAQNAIKRINQKI